MRSEQREKKVLERILTDGGGPRAPPESSSTTINIISSTVLTLNGGHVTPGVVTLDD